ncbi:uncharacterized protein LOC132309486 [Cornus florida]|uniref:uncharacterized protein LOC132309486 n=1 Tax=Cornus florida TaxID=4283 RepID=UPI00289E0993|nr:uncharacterized protein LOC132309486 [Cornus florida]
MNWATWSIRGLNSLLKLVEVKNLIRESKLSHSLENAVTVHSFITPNWNFACNYSNSILGRVWLLWNPAKIYVSLASMTSQVINCLIFLIYLKVACLASFFYAANIVMEKKSLWRSINSHRQLNVPWILLGDFNVLLHVNESFRGALRWTTGMEEFKACLNKNELEDQRFNGIFHSWSNKSFGCANISRKLDRILVNHAWISKFPHSECCFKLWGVSDHAPMVVYLGEIDSKKNLPSRFFNFWALHTDFLSIVAQGWQLEVNGTRMFRVVQKLRALKRPLNQLNKKDFCDILAKVKACKNDLFLCQSTLDQNPIDDHLRTREKLLAKKFSEMCLAKELFFKQKAQIHWLKEGDQNTAFFMRNFSSKCNRRNVESITNSVGAQLHVKTCRGNSLTTFRVQLINPISTI